MRRQSSLVACVNAQGKSSQQFWELYELFNITDLKLDGVYLPALVRQVRCRGGCLCCALCSVLLITLNSSACAAARRSQPRSSQEGWQRAETPSCCVRQGNNTHSTNTRRALSSAVPPSLLHCQVPKMLGLFFVVTFGSCLDVAAIQADMPHPIDFNRELGTVGLSNVIVGLSGAGYTGSYIFSQVMQRGVCVRACCV